MCAFTSSFAQLSTNELPVSFDERLKLAASKRDEIPIITMPKLDMSRIEAEDRENEAKDRPYRFGYSHKVSINLSNSGIWQELPNGDRLWRLNIICPDALSINFLYDKFWIPKEGKFFIYSKDRKHCIGAFTARNNKGDRVNVRGFATELVHGSDVILEYYQPKDITEDAIISIAYVIHGYRSIIGNGENRGLGASGLCQVNVNCPEGSAWQNEKKAVARIITGNNSLFTGALINTTNLDAKPYFLTANHSLYLKYNGGITYDAVSNPNLDYFVFYWNYEASGCGNPYYEPNSYTTSGATVVANNSYSDFALYRLNEDPMELTNYTPFYLGWDCSGSSGTSGVCIHHPKGDIKKISTVATTPISTDYYDVVEYPTATHWKVTWKATPIGHGTTEKGSSGSPLLNGEHRLIGQLHGGDSGCGESEYEPDWYGKFSVSWSGNNSIYRQLNCWLDSINTGAQTIEGLLVVPSAVTISTDQELYSNIRVTSSGQLTVQSEVKLMGNSRVIVEQGGQLVIDGGTLSNAEIELKVGASLQITNGGVIENRNDFIVPTGAIVNITNGEITKYIP